MNCLITRNNLIEYLEGGLDSSQRSAVEKHINTCNTCRDLSLLLHQTFQTIQAEKITRYDPYLFTRIQAALEKTDTKQSNFLFLRLLQPLVIAVSFLVVVYAGIWLGHTFSNQTTLTTDYKTELYFLNEIHGENYESALISE